VIGDPDRTVDQKQGGLPLSFEHTADIGQNNRFRMGTNFPSCSALSCQHIFHRVKTGKPMVVQRVLTGTPNSPI
jgi:hypothetical protein